MNCPKCDSKNVWFPNAVEGHCKGCHQYITTTAYDQDDIDKLTADRDRWKARAEALERAAKRTGMACTYCRHKKNKPPIREDPCNTCPPHSLSYPAWEFDEAWFKEGAE